jgi:glycosyltransferase involved in cell wall biosynthesis
MIGSKRLGGAEKFFSRLVNGLHERGMNPHAMIARKSELLGLLDPGLPRTELPMMGHWDYYSRWRIQRIISQHDFPIVQTYLGRASRLTHLEKFPKVTHICRIGGYYKTRHYLHADFWIGITRGICDHLVRGGIPSNRIEMIGNFAEPKERLPQEQLDALKSRLGIAPDTKVICSVGRLHQIKGLDILLRAFAKSGLHRGDVRHQLLLVGNGPERAALALLADHLEIGPAVIWAGWQEDPSPYYQLADFMVFPSRQEGFGSVILEAWANRTAVLASMAEGPSELIDSGVNGLLVAIEAVEELKDALLQMAAQPALRQQLAEHGYQTLMRNFLPATILDQYASLYTKLIESRKQV